MRTILLNVDTWDLVADSSGNIASATDPYSQVQDVASAARLFEGELWYDTVPGIPYFSLILGKTPSVALLKTAFTNAALRVPGVVSAKCLISSIANRTITGQLQITTDDGTNLIVPIRQVIPETP